MPDFVPDLPHTISAAQRTFVDAAEALGAARPADARPLAEFPRLSVRELEELVDVGLVREATDGRYYLFRPRRSRGPQAAAGMLPPSRAPWMSGRFVRTVLFWLLLILIPILLLRLSATR